MLLTDDLIHCIRVYNITLSENKKDAKGIKSILSANFKRVTSAVQSQSEVEPDIVSNNAKIVLYGLFALIGFAILLYTVTVTREIDIQGVEQVNMVYIAAISGALALGGTLIAQIWGRGK
jgi:hypothetical protein